MITAYPKTVTILGYMYGARYTCTAEAKLYCGALAEVTQGKESIGHLAPTN